MIFILILSEFETDKINQNDNKSYGTLIYNIKWRKTSTHYVLQINLFLDLNLDNLHLK